MRLSTSPCPVLIQPQRAEDFIHGQVRQQAFCDQALAFGLGERFLREAFQRAEQAGGQLIDAQHHRLRLIVRDGAQQTALFCERNDLGDVGQNLLAAFGAGAGRTPRRGPIAPAAEWTGR